VSNENRSEPRPSGLAKYFSSWVQSHVMQPVGVRRTATVRERTYRGWDCMRWSVRSLTVAVRRAWIR